MRTSPHILYLKVTSIALALVVCVSGTVLAVPTTPEIGEKQEELGAAQAELDRMADDFSLMVEEYNAISEALDETEALLEVTRADLALALLDEENARETLGGRAAEIYRGGGVDMLQVLLGTHSFADFLVRLDWLEEINRQDAQLLEEVRAARARVEEAEAALEAQQAEQSALKAEAESQKLRIERELERQEEYVESLDDEIKRLIAEEEERQRRLAEERARQAEEEARRAAEAAGIDLTGIGSSGGPGRPEIVTLGLRYLGVPYVWGGTSPVTGFDCSGLCQYVYGEAGIAIPRTSRSQFRAGSHIEPGSIEALELGDLVFFGYGGDPGRVHHVGIYAGEGNYLHAPGTGLYVRVDSLVERVASRGDYVGASRF